MDRGNCMQCNTQAFIVRVWDEETDGDSSVVIHRGSIEHVSTRRKIYFEDAKEILSFIEEVLRSGSRLPARNIGRQDAR